MTDTATPPLAFLDTETTGLDSRVHQPWEVCFWREDYEVPFTFSLPHTLEHADQRALDIGGYWDRHSAHPPATPSQLAHALHGCTLVGANPAFDQAMLTRFIGAPVWHYRSIDVCTGAMWLAGWERPRSLVDTATELRAGGFEIHAPDHTAEGDVRAVRDIYYALRTPRRVILPSDVGPIDFGGEHIWTLPPDLSALPELFRSDADGSPS